MVATGRPTMRTVAELAGVSTATVSYVLSGRAGTSRGASVSEATIERVRAVAADLGYRPSLAARAVRTGRTGLALLSLTMLSDPWSLEVVSAVGSRFAPHGLTPLVLADGDWTDAAARQTADVIFVDDVRGPEDCEAIHALAARGTRLVVFSESLEPDGFDVIRSVAGPGCEMVLEHLFAATEDVACLSMVPLSEVSKSRRASQWVTASELHAGGVDPGRYLECSSQEDAYAAAHALLARPDRPRAIFAVSDFAAISAVRAALRLGLEPGRDVLIAGVGNTGEGARLNPSLTSAGPIHFFDRLASIILEVAQSDGQRTPVRHEFPWQLFIRETTSPD